MIQVYAKPKQYIWNMWEEQKGNVSLKVHIEYPKKIDEIKIRIADNKTILIEGEDIKEASRDKHTYRFNYPLKIQPGEQQSLSVTDLLVNGTTVPQDQEVDELSFEIDVLSPFYHWIEYSIKNDKYSINPITCLAPIEQLKTAKGLLEEKDFLWIYGPPGIGKSCFIKQLLTELEDESKIKTRIVYQPVTVLDFWEQGKETKDNLDIRFNPLV